MSTFMLMRHADDATEALASGAAVLDQLLHGLQGPYAASGPAAPGLALALALAPGSQALRLALRPDGESVTEGPFAAGERTPAGFAIFEAPSKEAAVELLRAWPAGGASGTGGEVLLELRETGCPGGCARVELGAAGSGPCWVILLRSDEALERDAVPARDKLDALNAFNALEAQAGVLLAGDGLKSSARGARARLREGRASVIDGPFAEAKELIAGFWMIRAASRADALAWARRLPYPTGPRVEVDIREVAAFAGLPSALPGAAPLSAQALDEDRSLRAEGLDAALRAELAAAPAWHRP